jgi:hypothetical protein
MKVAIVSMAAKVRCESSHLGELVFGEAAEYRFGSLGPLGRVASSPRCLKGGKAHRVDQQDSKRLDRPLSM